ncbi:hypothetical protein vBAspATola_25 [Aeromonas phage vB_AspA_Tola]|nr:hypothetical protein vBAspATola_25 [Aeromonas phage vB_AspA_Tola]
MNRLRVLKKRANKMCIGVVKIDNKYYVAGSSGCRHVGYLDGPFSKREAIHFAARMAPPSKPVKVTIVVGN